MARPQPGSDQRGARWDRADLRGADLRGVDFQGASLVMADLRDADLTGARLLGADLSGANLGGARMHGVDWTGTRREGTWFADLGDDQAWSVASAKVAELVDHADHADADDVLAELDELGVVAPDWAWAWVAVALAFRRVGRADVAFDVLLSATSMHPTPLARRWLGRLFIERGDHDSAVSTLIKARADRPSDDALVADLGYALGRCGRWVEAKEALERAISLGRDDANTWGALGLVRHELRDRPGAIEAMRRAAEGGAPEHRLNLARLFEALGDSTSAWVSLDGATEPILVAERARLAAEMGGEESMWMQGVPAPPADGPVEIGLPVSPAEVDALRRSRHDLGSKVLHLVFASPVAVGIVLPAQRGARVAWKSERGWEVGGEVIVGNADIAESETVVRAWSPTADVALALPLFDGRTCGSELAFRLPSGLPEGLRRRLRAFDRVLERDFDLDERDIQGSTLLLDGLSPDLVFEGPEGPVVIAPPGSWRRGSDRWATAQWAAWTCLDRESALYEGAVRLRRGVIWPGEDAGERRRIAGLACVVWARHHLALAALWPERRAPFLGRGLDAVSQAESGQWPV